ncbi:MULTISPECIES: CAMP factor family pore-forming toxin [Anaerococcus]|uniref:cAMP factor n=4 Tax=Anaerococcus TaxID=165779 RepID=A0A3E2TJ52_9FIRM|nr:MULTISPECIES: CAMP factor family pore-forming toxin [Anaerococcus]MBP2070388.1 hypothetical protein [Anaerococcus nagyae]MDU3211955.1 CAMP factor family pore-forming toxin [Anaerococcus sp.]RGB77041.1 hypothetical protein DXA39_02100 [Anaerococcus nagyae]
MKKNKVLVGALSITLLTNTILPATKIAKNTSPVISSVAYAAESSQADQAQQKLDHLGDLIKGLENIAGGLAGDQLSWLKELKHAYEVINKILTKGIGSISEIRNKIIPRIDLLINVAETITADATELADSEQQAHVIIGFSVTRALLKATDLFENAEGLKKASDNLTASLEKAREIPKLTDNSKRTHYTLEQLDRAIARAKEIRNKELRNKLDPTELSEVDMVIRKAQDVRRNRVATVGEVKAMTEELNNKIDEAYKAIPEGERTANKSSKAGLQKDIQTAKNLRDFRLKGKVESVVIAELNREISNANRVLNNSRSTLNEVAAADEAILAAIEKAQSKLEAIPAKEETPEKPAVEEETSTEEVVTPEEENTEETSEEETSEAPAEDEASAEEENEEVPAEEAETVEQPVFEEAE